MSQDKGAAINRFFIFAIVPISFGVTANWIWANLSGFDVLQKLFNVIFLLIFKDNERVAKAFADGTKYTIVLSITSCVLGTIIGCAVAWWLRYARRDQRRMAMILYNSSRYILLNIALTIPLYMMLYFGLYSGFMPRMSPIIIAIIMLSFNLSFFVTKIVLGGFQVLPIDQIEAARVCGFSNFGVVMKYEIPFLWNAIGNALIVEWTTTIKLSSFVGLIGVFDLMQAVLQEVQYSPQLAFKIYATATTIYMTLIFPLLLIAEKLEILKHRDVD